MTRHDRAVLTMAGVISTGMGLLAGTAALIYAVWAGTDGSTAVIGTLMALAAASCLSLMGAHLAVTLMETKK